MLTVLGELVVDLIPVPGPTPAPRAPPPSSSPAPAATPQRRGRRRAAGPPGAPAGPVRHRPAGRQPAPARRAVRVDVSRSVDSGDPVSLAVVGLAPDGSADYGFHVLGAADWQWTDDEVAAAWPPGPPPCTWAPSPPGPPPAARPSPGWPSGCTPTARRWSASTPTSGCPWRRGSATPPRRPAPAGRLLAVADVVKVSAEDLAWLEPGTTDLDEAVQRWADRGPGVVLLTDGGEPLRVARPGRPLLQHTPPTVARRRHRRGRRLPGRRVPHRPAGRRGHHPRRPGRRGRRPARAGGRRRRAWWRAVLHPGGRRPAHPRRARRARR